MGLDHGDVCVSNAQISEYVSLGIGSRQNLQKTNAWSRDKISCLAHSVLVSSNLMNLHCKF